MRWRVTGQADRAHVAVLIHVSACVSRAHIPISTLVALEPRTFVRVSRTRGTSHILRPQMMMFSRRCVSPPAYTPETGMRAHALCAVPSFGQRDMMREHRLHHRRTTRTHRQSHACATRPPSTCRGDIACRCKWHLHQTLARTHVSTLYTHTRSCSILAHTAMSLSSHIEPVHDVRAFT